MTAELQDTAPVLKVKLKAGGTLRLPNTVSNRKVMAVLLRLLEDGEGRTLYTFEEISALLDYADRRNTHNFWREFVQAGSDFHAFCERQRKLTSAVHTYIAELWRRDPLLPTTAICQRVKARFGLAALSAEAVRQAASQLDYNPIRRALHKQLERGEVHYREEWLRAELFGAVELMAAQVGADQHTSVARWAQLPRGPALPPKEGKHAPIPRACEWLTVATPEEVQALWQGPLGLTLLMALLYVHGVSLSVLSRWFGLHRSSIYRRMLRLAQGDWEPMVTEVVRGVFAGVACVDEKWLQIRGQWWYFFVAVDPHTSFPLHWALLPTCTTGACRWFLLGLKRKGYRPWALVTDGLKGYEGAIRSSFPHARHQRCLFHVLQAAGRWLWEHMSDDGATRGLIREALRRLLQTRDRRTVWRRFARFQTHALGWGVTELAEQVGAILPQVLPAIGNRRLPRTNNAAERFFRAFSRFARARNGFGSPASARLQIQLFVLGSFVELVARLAAQGQLPQTPHLEHFQRTVLYQMWTRPNMSLLQQQCRPRDECTAQQVA